MTRRRSSRAPGAIHIEDPFFLSFQVSNHIIDDPTKHMGRGVSSSPGGNERMEGGGDPVLWSNIHPIILEIIFKTDTRSGDASSSEEPNRSPLVMRDQLNFYYLWKELFTNGL